VDTGLSYWIDVAVALCVAGVVKVLMVMLATADSMREGSRTSPGIEEAHRTIAPVAGNASGSIGVSVPAWGPVLLIAALNVRRLGRVIEL
jgi:hypothetical protein